MLARRLTLLPALLASVLLALFMPADLPVSATDHAALDQAAAVTPATVTTGGLYVAVPPARILDTRTGAGGVTGAVPANTTVTFAVLGRGGIPATGAAAAALNLTATGATTTGYLTAYRDGTTPPTTSNVNFVRGTTVANLAVLTPGSNGRIAITNHSAGTVHVIVDAVGWYRAGTPSAPGSWAGTTPARILDTRTGSGGVTGAVPANTTVTFTVLGRGGIPATGAAAAALNLTATGATTTGYLTAYRDGTTPPTTSNVNFVRGTTVANLAVLTPGSNGRIAITNHSAGTVHVIVDAVGWYRTVRAYPLRLSADQRTLVDATGTPYPILGRAAWFLLSLSATDQQLFLDDTAAKGFDAIEVGIGHDPRGNNAPRNGNGDLPFLRTLAGQAWGGSLTYSDPASQAPDFTTPNPTYWASVDALVSAARARGLAVLFFPGYVGYAGGEQGWMAEMTANGETRMRSYGSAVANRYRTTPNIVWMIGGDYAEFTVQQAAAEKGLIDGLQSVAGQSTFYSAEWSSGMSSSEQQPFGARTNLDGAYDWRGGVIDLGRRAYTSLPLQPAFLLEEPYDEEGPDGNSVNPSATQPVRRFQWWGWLSTIGGHVAGNGYVWPFRAGWKDHLDTQGARDLARLNAFVTGIDWQRLVPSGLDGMRSLVTAGGGSGESSVTAAATPDGRLLVAYVPPAHQGSVTIDLAALRGPVSAEWYDPTSARVVPVGGSPYPNSGPVAFDPPGSNAAGEADWVLVLRSS